MSASCFYFFKGLFSTEVSKNLPFTDLKKCDKIYPKLIDTKINNNSSQLNASEGHSDLCAMREIFDLYLVSHKIITLLSQTSNNPTLISHQYQRLSDQLLMTMIIY